MKKKPLISLIFTLSLTGGFATAAPINTNTALPVHEGEFLWREQASFLKAKDSTRDKEVITVSSVFVYGVTEKLAFIGTVPYVDKSLKENGVERGDSGLGDSTLLARYEIYHLDRPAETFRAQALAGLKFPTGEDDESDEQGRLPQTLQLGSGSYDPVVGGVFTWQTQQWQVDLDSVYKINTEANDFQFGDVLSHNASLQYRIWPQELPEQGNPSFTYGVLELNGVWARRNEMNDSDIADSGGYTLFISPGLQYVTMRWITEVSIQLPVIQDLNGDQVKTDYILSAGFRAQF